MPSAARAILPQHHADHAAERLIVALDVPTVKEADEIVDQLGDEVSFYKLGLHLQLAEGLFGFARRLLRARKKIFLDFKYIDIDDTIEGVISSAVTGGIDFVTVYQSPQVIKAAVRGRGSKNTKPKILTVTLLTDRDQDYIRSEFKWEGSVTEFVVHKAKMVQAMGGDGVICSPQEVCAVRQEIRDPRFLIVTPGIRPDWSRENGHKRIGTPTDAIGCGADYLVVGRPIIKAGNKREAAVRIIDEMQAAFDNLVVAA